MYIVKKKLKLILKDILEEMFELDLSFWQSRELWLMIPKLFIGDEPTGNLDKETETEILDIFTNLAHEDNKCVIIISHSSSVKEKVDVVLNLKEGHVVNSSRKS